jgi:hypothetical protein
VKLIDIKDEESPRPKLSLSMKYCDQGSGRDLDVNCVKLSMIRTGQVGMAYWTGLIHFSFFPLGKGIRILRQAFFCRILYEASRFRI